jgi:hypothetical protein
MHEGDGEGRDIDFESGEGVRASPVLYATFGSDYQALWTRRLKVRAPIS